MTFTFPVKVFRQGDVGFYWYAVISGTLDVYVSEFEVRTFGFLNFANVRLQLGKHKWFLFVVNFPSASDHCWTTFPNALIKKAYAKYNLQAQH